jgi:hypothetical protein
MKFGFQMYYVRWNYQNNAQLNGTFVIPSNNSFNPAVPSTYPERLTIQAPTDQVVKMTQWAYTGFVQDKWHVSHRATLNLGLRYDVDFTPLDETNNPAFSDPHAYPVDKNNISPRVGFTYTMDEGKYLIRTGWGLFYDKTNFGQLVNYVTSGVIVPSVTVQFPADNIDPGPRAGKLPTNPMLVNGPNVNYALLNSLYPPGSNQRNTGDVYLDTPDRVQPHTQEISAGFQRQLGPALSVSADYVHTIARDQWMLGNPEPGWSTRRLERSFSSIRPRGASSGDLIGSIAARSTHRGKALAPDWAPRPSTLTSSRRASASLASTNNYQVLNTRTWIWDRDRPISTAVTTGAGRPHRRSAAHARHDAERHLRVLSGLAFSCDSSSDPTGTAS